MMKKIKYLIPSLAFVLPIAALAVEKVEVSSVSELLNKITTITNYFSAFVLAIAVIMIIYAGFNFMKGSEEGIAAGKQTLTFAIVGILVALFAWSITAIVKSMF